MTETIASTLTIRLAAMPESKYFCTPIEERFERITRIARKALRVPVAAVTLISHDRQWFKSAAGWPVSELPLENTLCRLTIEEGKLVAIPDTRADPRSKDNPLVTNVPRFRAYAAYPILNEDRLIAGTFCVFDTKPRAFTNDDCETLTDLAALAQRELVGEKIRGAHEEIVSKLGIARREAMVDPLTRLWNRRGAMVMLAAGARDACKEAAPLTVALMDIDNFKVINDTHGHQVGDEVLRKLATRLIRSARMTDIACRIGGDEFLLILGEADRPTADAALERIRETIASKPIMTRQAAINVSLSIGYYVQAPGEAALNADTLLERADVALMKAKMGGRNRIELASA